MLCIMIKKNIFLEGKIDAWFNNSKKKHMYVNYLKKKWRDGMNHLILIKIKVMWSSRKAWSLITTSANSFSFSSSLFF